MSNGKVEVNASIKVTGTTESNKKIDGVKRSTESLEAAFVKLQKQQQTAAQFSNNAARNFAKSSAEYSKVIQLYASTAATIFTVSSAFQALKSASQTLEMQNSMKTLTAITGYSVASMVKDLKELSNNAISTSEAMRAANLSAAAGIDPATFRELGLAAKGAAKALGRDYADALDRISKGVIKAEPELLDELGIIIRLDNVYKEYAATLGTTAIKLTEFQKTQARTDAVIKQAQEKYGTLAATPASDIDKIAAAADDMVKSITGIGVSIAGVIAPLVTTSTGMLAVFAAISTVITKNWVPGIDEAGEKVRLISNQNQQYRKSLIANYNLLTQEEQLKGRLTVQEKIHLSLARASLEQKQRLLVLERQHIAATAERKTLEILDDPTISSYQKLRGIVAQISLGVGKINVDYRNAILNVNGISAASLRWLAIQTAVSKAVLVTKVAMTALSATFGSILGWVGVLTTAFTLADMAYEKFFKSDSDKKRETALSNISSLMEDQVELIKVQQRAMQNLTGTFDNFASVVKNSYRGLSQLGAAILDIPASSEANWFSKRWETLFGSKDLTARKQAKESFVQQISIINKEFGLAAEKLFDPKTFEIKDKDRFKSFIDGLKAIEKPLSAASDSLDAATASYKEFTNVDQKKTLFTPALSSLEQARAGALELEALVRVSRENVERDLQKVRGRVSGTNFFGSNPLMGGKPDSQISNIISQATGVVDPETGLQLSVATENLKLYTKEIETLYSKLDLGTNEPFGTKALSTELDDIIVKLEDMETKIVNYRDNLNLAKKGTNSNVRASAKSSIQSSGTVKSLFGSSSKVLDQELTAQMTIQKLNLNSLNNQEDLTKEYLKALEITKANTHGLDSQNQIQNLINEAEIESARIAKEKADAKETEITLLEKSLRLTQAKTAEELNAVQLASKYFGMSGSEYSGQHAQILEATSALISYKGAAEMSANASKTLGEAQASRASATDIAIATDLAAAAAANQMKVGVELASQAIMAISSMMSVSSKMASDAIGIQIQLEEKRDGQSEESQKKIKTLREKQIKEDAKAKRQQIMMSTAVGIMNAFAAPGMNPLIAMPIAAIVAALGAQQLAAVSQAESGQLALLNTSSSLSSNASNSTFNVGSAGSVDVAKSSNTSEINQYRASGGTVSAGTSVTLGERGPEQVVFNEDVMVKSNAKASDNPKQQPLNVNINVSALDGADATNVLKNNAAAIISTIREEARAQGYNFFGG